MVNPINPGFTPNPFNLPETWTDMKRTMSSGGSSTTPQQGIQPQLNLGTLVAQQQANPAAWGSNWRQMLAQNPQAAAMFGGGQGLGQAPINTQGV